MYIYQMYMILFGLVLWHINPCSLLLYRWFNKGIPQVQAEELASLSESD